jgi:hypothetical protein
VSEQRHFLPFRHRKSNHRNKKIANPMNNKTLQPLNRRRADVLENMEMFLVVWKQNDLGRKKN